MKAIITVGISASGKTTWAKEYAKANKNTIITNRDDLRFSLTGTTGWGDYKFNKNIENIVTNIQMHTIFQAKIAGKDVVIADTNLSRVKRSELAMLLGTYGYEVEIKDFPVTLEEAWKRDGLRANGVGRDVIYKQWGQWLTYTGRKQYVPDESHKKAVIFDVDGTLMHRGERGPFDWARVGEDTVDPVVREMFWDFKSSGYAMLVVSGRDSVCWQQTYESLSNAGIVCDAMIMRTEGDCRKDTIIKEEIFWNEIAPYYNVCAVVDDRPCVVRMWHDIKIPKVIAVGNQSVEF